ncbi:MAG: dihydroorotase [Nitrospirae bacterium]|nr:dihydroorotase [Nitrospirota bacterium]
MDNANRPLNLLIDSIRLVDPDRHSDGTASVLIEDGLVKKIARAEAEQQVLRARARMRGSSLDVLNGRDLVIFPGLVDVHVHLREPGFEYKETVKTGCAAAARGGFTAVCAMANTQPVNDCRAVTEFILKKAAEVKGVQVHPIGAASKGLQGKELAEIGDMKSGGIVAVSDDGKPVLDSGLMRRALEYARTFGLPVVSHCEDSTLCPHGVMHEGVVSTRLGLEGMPAEAEEIMVSRDIHLAGLTGARLHLAHISTAGSVELVRRAKHDGLPVTAEVTPHHLLLTHESLMADGGYNTHFKMNPPLRTIKDGEALAHGLQDGTIDCIATDHAPHSADDKSVEFASAPFGVIGLETALAVGLFLVHKGVLTYLQLAEKMSLNPSKVFNLSHGRILEGRPASLAIFDPHRSWTVKAAELRSKSRNSAFENWTFTGDTAYTIGMGTMSYRADWARPFGTAASLADPSSEGHASEPEQDTPLTA